MTWPHRQHPLCLRHTCEFLFRLPETAVFSMMGPFEGSITPICANCRHALRLPAYNQRGSGDYTPVGQFDFLYTISHTFEPHESHDGACAFYVFLLQTMRATDVTAMVRDQIGLEEQVRRMQPPFVMHAEFWFRDDFADRDGDRQMEEQFDECLLIGSLYFPLKPGMSRRCPQLGGLRR